jgi:hypothetical protein
VIVGDISESDVTQEISGLGFEVPLGEDLIHAVKIGLSNVKIAPRLDVATIHPEIAWDILSQEVK